MYDDELDNAPGWTEYFCIASPSVIIRVRLAEGGERYGNLDFNHRAKEGENLCLNPENGHRWVMSDLSLKDFYSEAKEK